MKPEDGRRRVIIQNVQPEIDAGRYPIKRSLGETVAVEADVFADGHGAVSCALHYRRPDADGDWTCVRMASIGNDRWRAEFRVETVGRWEYTIEGWLDDFATWQSDLAKRVDARQDIAIDLKIGADLVDGAAARAEAAGDAAAEELRGWAKRLRTGKSLERRTQLALGEELRRAVDRFPDLAHASRYERTLGVWVDRQRASFGTWYELFPRAAARRPGAHGTFDDVRARLPELAEMGFDVLYLPPIHPIGRTHRKGPNNQAEAGPRDPGSPWAIGSKEGGHLAIHPQLGSLESFKTLIGAARDLGMEIALDLAFQCSPDHPYVSEHPEWFRKRPDGAIQYAENPPKKYEDIYPFDFDTPDWESLWDELKRVTLYWLDQGVKIFRVDNPHTKPFAFWAWLIEEVKAVDPEVLFLAEAFTRPKVMYQLAKLGFTQSYSYFAWRNSAWELRQYFTELSQSPVAEFFRPNLWPNTPDILTAYLQTGTRGAFLARLVLAATLGASYGIYGPAFELLESRPLAPGSEEYLDSDKYQIRAWDRARGQPMRDFIGLINQIRREHPSLQSDRRLVFHDIDNPALLCYSKGTPDRSDVILTCVSVDPYHVQGGWANLNLGALGLEGVERFEVHELLTDVRFSWQGDRVFIKLDPDSVPAHILRIPSRGSG